MKPLLYIVDVFAEEKYAGNQLAVFRNAQHISSQEMQRIAREMNFSETTFIISEDGKDGGYDVRIFTPNEEIPFAGHPTLGTAFIIQQEIIKDQVELLTLKLKVGDIPVSFTYEDERVEEMWMTQVPPVSGASATIDELAAVLGLDTSDFDDRFPIQEVSTGLPALIVPLKDLDAVQRARINEPAYFDFVEAREGKNILIFSNDTYHSENDLNVRVFATYFGVPEDPATGSANGCLAGYLSMNRYFGSEIVDARVEQGYEMKRPSLLLLRAREVAGDIQVKVGGQAILSARGELV